MASSKSPCILITSGGTEVAIDPVRSIKNKSTGNFATSLACAALKNDAEVIYLAASSSRTPFSTQIDFNHQSLETINQEVSALTQFKHASHGRYREYRYTTFEEYSSQLQRLLLQYQPEVVILAAAVSDYLVENYTEEKVRTHQGLTLKLQVAPKVIQQIKHWLPQTFLIGFKMLIDASDDELVEAAFQGFKAHQANLIIANNLASIQRSQHEVLLVEPGGQYLKITSNIASTIINDVLTRVRLC